MSASLQVLVAAIAQRQAAIIRTGGRRADDALHIAFLADGRSSREDGIWVELVRGELGLVDRLISSHLHVEVSFNSGHSLVHFDTLLIMRQRRFMRNERILLTWPAQVRVTERRRAERELVPNEAQVTALLKTGDGRGDLPLHVWDLSETGACLVYPTAQRPPKLEPGDAIQICLSFWGADHHLTALFRRTQTMPDGRVKLGVEFCFESASALAAQAALSRLIDELKSRRIRNTLGSALGGRSVA